jgi:opacity protein-like surface antigen
MTKLHIAIAAALAITASQAASAATIEPVEGGLATGITLSQPAAGGAGHTLDRATVAAEARLAGRSLDSRSGQQSDAERGVNLQLTSTRSRAEVRAEAAAYVRESDPQVFEGGESATWVPAAPSTSTAVASQLQGATTVR